jgi:hypothetical protein
MIFVNKTFQKYSNAKAYYHKWVDHDCEIEILLIRDNENHEYKVIDREMYNHLVYEYDLDCEVLYN